MPLGKNIKRYFSFKEVVIVLLAVTISVAAGVGVFLSLKKEVVINDGEKQIVVKTMKTTVREVLEQNGINVRPEDYVSLQPDSHLQRIRTNVITIKRAVPINVLADGRVIKLLTYRNTVGEVLSNSPVVLSKSDRLDGVSPGDKVVEDMTIKVIRVKEKLISEKTSIPFKTITRENTHMDKGREKILEEGKEGVREKLFKVVLEDGKEIARNLVSNSVILAPVNELIELGSVLNHTTSRGEVIRYRKVMPMRATAYTASYKDTGKHPGDYGFGITYTGIKARRGVIAVDPRVIPLGTKVYVEVSGKTPDYGYAVAADTGGAIKGDLIDLYMDGQDTVDNWGCKRVKVYILVDN